MSQAARESDKHLCPQGTPSAHGAGEIQEGSPNVMIAGLPAARVGDTIQCEDGSLHPIIESKACLLINGKPAARVNDKTAHGGKIKSGASSVHIADGKPFIRFGNKHPIRIGGNAFFGMRAAAVAGLTEGAEFGVVGGPLGALLGGFIGLAIGYAIDDFIYRRQDKEYKKPPDTLPAFPDAIKVPPKTRNKGSKSRARWVDSKGRIYEWDYQHGTVEVYDKTGKKHLGEFNPDTGEQTKPPHKSRKTVK